MAQGPVAAVQTGWRAFGALDVRLDSFGTDLDHLVHFRGKSKFSILVGFWHLSRVRGLFVCDDGLQTL